MNKRQTRIFALASTGVAVVIFLGLTLDSHRQFPKLTHSENITDSVIRGQNVWHKNNCINCHTILGEGAYYAPDLTKITQHRGTPYLTAFLKDPSQFYDETKHRRLMPKQDIDDQDIAAVRREAERLVGVESPVPDLAEPQHILSLFLYGRG
ncbi:MAG: c-type cytochrome, partial [Pollutimonas bauzanensis]